jgi:poly(3-hydroxybutyrate) depolymerase
MKKAALSTTLVLLVSIFALLAHAKDSPKTQWTKEKIGQVSYWMYKPNVKVNKFGLMISLHGCAQNADDIKNLGNWEAAAEKAGWVVVAPEVPNGGVIYGCWDYYGKSQSETNHNNIDLLALTAALMNDQTLNIDTSKVFVAGLSSGAAQAMLLGCLRPDIFKGVAINAGPSIGSEANDIHQPKVSADEVVKYCLELAGNRANGFANQRVSLVIGDQDSIVSTAYATLNLEAFKSIYKSSAKKVIDLKTFKGSYTAGHGEVYSDSLNEPRVSFIVNTSLEHAWPAGKDASAKTFHFVNPKSIDYPDYLASFF